MSNATAAFDPCDGVVPVPTEVVTHLKNCTFRPAPDDGVNTTAGFFDDDLIVIP